METLCTTDRLRNTVAEVSLSKLRDNYRTLRALLPLGSSGWICPMVKANAYGHGEIHVAQSLQDVGADALGVALIEEGIRLRANGITIPILVFGTFDTYSVEELLRFNLTPVLSSWEQIKVLTTSIEGDSPRSVHIKFNTGMSRLGFDVSQASSLSHELSKNRKLRLSGICTHLLNGDDVGNPDGASVEQLKRFEKVVREFPDRVQVHAYNSAALTQSSPTIYGARPGIALYGYGVRGEVAKSIHPVLSLRARIVLIRSVLPGEGVSYHARWKASKTSTIGVVPVGYADGFSRSLGNRGCMLYRGFRVPVVGNVCMDYTMVDLTNALVSGPALVGEEVVIIGRQASEEITAEEIATQLGTISYEVLTSISSRVPRLYT